MEDWISVKDQLPKETGWYKVKHKDGFITEVPYTRKMSGELVWLTIGDTDVTHWVQPINNKPTLII